ncbi:molybdopterin adenylyltransferase [Syntrophobotulus glycolicus DSM 8271]|uniref:Molybdopterin adenylyltransferase n=1 Tax=Syntrophobotulus glycolicus (strain DSM 8271 / FlGlyR) TaxID=645991 RepID=F0T0H2_SYNGF|nr:MogA/MoaB family molybdenum cofactor biosynthesis protein [Syntrophobotulus glycolicus]ADY57344.1 molybdopterin adenylyltransferase [Syntrophobotulus glycolicus DSM 8271]
MIRVGILTVSDRGASGEREDQSGPLIKEIMQNRGWETAACSIIPDERKKIAQKLIEYADDLNIDVVFTTGGTGFAPRDVTPEATLDVVERLAPGLVQAILFESLKITPRAMLSRAVSGIRGGTIIVNLPGSPKAVRECLDVVLPALEHGVQILRGETGDCAENQDD